MGTHALKIEIDKKKLFVMAAVALMTATSVQAQSNGYDDTKHV